MELASVPEGKDGGNFVGALQEMHLSWFARTPAGFHTRLSPVTRWKNGEREPVTRV